MLKRIISGITAAVSAAVLLAVQAPARHAEATNFSPNCTVMSESAVLYNIDLDTVCYERNADMKELPAALTQIMTAVVVLENCADITTETVTATDEMFDTFRAYEFPDDLRYAKIQAEDTLTVEDLLYAMMLTSSCEASTMLATHFGSGDQANFVEKMNAKAKELGMTNTRFTNATGLYSARQVSTARDMMTLLIYAMSLPNFEKISCSNNYTPPSAEEKGKTEDWNWEHSNLMAFESSDYYCSGVHGIKTGTLDEGGRSIACKASRDGNNYLIVCMNAPITDDDGNNKFYHLEDATNILEWAFLHLSFQEVLPQNEELDEIEVVNAEGNNYVILRPAEGYSCIWCDTFDVNSVQRIANWETSVNAPVQAGQKLGTLTLKFSGETLAEVDVIAASSVQRSFWKYNLAEIPGFFRSKYLRATWVTAIVLSVVYIALCAYFTVQYKKRRAARKEASAQGRAPRPRR